MHDYRRRKQIVTYQGSHTSESNALLIAKPADISQSKTALPQPVVISYFQCHFCGRQCSELLRLDFLYRRRVRYFNPFDLKGNRHDYSP
jgi:hypothetical protein